MVLPAFPALTPEKKDFCKRADFPHEQVAGIQRMIEENRYCVDILNQISAVRSALDALGVELLSSQLQTPIIGRESPHPKFHSVKGRNVWLQTDTLSGEKLSCESISSLRTFLPKIRNSGKKCQVADAFSRFDPANGYYPDWQKLKVRG